MTTGKQSSLELQTNKIIEEGKTDTDKQNIPSKNYQIRKDLIYLPISEHEEHKEFINKFNSPIWKEIDKN